MAEKLDSDFGRKLLIDSDVTICSICLRSWISRRPKNTCLFSYFLYELLTKYIGTTVSINKNNNKFDCPNCRMECVLPVGGVDSLQANAYFINAASVGSVSAKSILMINDNENQLLCNIENHATDMKNQIEKQKKQLKEKMKEKFEVLIFYFILHNIDYRKYSLFTLFSFVFKEFRNDCWLLEDELNDSKTCKNDVLLKLSSIVEKSKNIEFEPNSQQDLLGSIKGESVEKYNNSDSKEKVAPGFNFPIRPSGWAERRNFYYTRRWRLKERKSNWKKDR